MIKPWFRSLLRLLPRVAVAALLAIVARGAPADTCMAQRAASNFNCTANDVRITSFTMYNGPSSCVSGQSVIVGLIANIQTGSAVRYDVGIYVGADGKSPEKLPPTGSSNCVVRTLPFAPSPFANQELLSQPLDVCGDTDGTGGAGPRDLGVNTLTCTDSNGDGVLDFPFSVSWRQPGDNLVCSGASDAFLYPGTSSKCNAGQWDLSGVTVCSGSANLLHQKSVQAISDPINGTANPKSIPGAVEEYTLRVTNTGACTADNIANTDPIPANTELFVGDLGGAGSGPVSFTEGSPSSGLTWTYTAPGSPLDSLEFSNNGGATYTYTPLSSGYDPAVTHIRMRPQGTMARSTVAGDPYFELRFRVRVK